MAVTFNELTPSPTFTVTPGGAQAQRIGLVAWDDIEDFAEEVLPSSVEAGVDAGQFVGAGYPGKPWLRVTQLQIEPFTQRVASGSVNSSGVAKYTSAKCTLAYSTRQLEFGGIPELPVEPLDRRDPVSMLSHNLSVGGEWLTIPSVKLQWKNYSSESVSEDVEAGIYIPIIEHRVTWPRVVNPPFEAIRSKIGKVNSTSGTFQTGIFAKETLLFLGAEMSREIMSNGDRAWNVTYMFSERRVVSRDSEDTVNQDPDIPGGWNHFFGGEEGGADIGFYPGFYRLQRKDGEPIYELTTFEELFQPG